MDFARKQLEKYGWTDGKGLGKNENGMAEALKPKLKRSMTGVGHDAASDFTDHWWSTLYDKAASNIEVKEKNGNTKKIKTKNDTEFEITNSTWKLKRKKSKLDAKSQEQYENFFVKTAVLGSGGSRIERIKEQESDSEDEEVQKDVFKMTDEELFAACEGRTAHKGARHGLKALGKLSRIEQQEKLLLQQSRFNGYSHANKPNKDREYEEEIIEVASLNCDEVVPQKKRKKEKKKHCLKQENVDCPSDKLDEIKNAANCDVNAIPDADNTNFEDGAPHETLLRNKKKKKHSTIDKVNGGKIKNMQEGDLQSDVTNSSSKKRKKKKYVDAINEDNCETDNNISCKVKLSKKNKNIID